MAPSLRRPWLRSVRTHLAYRKPVTLAPGLSASVPLVVAEADTALAMGSGDVPVLATPRVVALAEQATIQAVTDELATGATTVGYEVQLAHLAPTPVGAKVTAEVTLESIEGRRLTFRVSVNDARGLVAAGRITRVIVARDRFIERARAEG
jgi:predicted thioesterase